MNFRIVISQALSHDWRVLGFKICPKLPVDKLDRVITNTFIGAARELTPQVEM